MEWTKERVAKLLASTPHGEDKVLNMLRELSATQAAVENLSRTPSTVWFTHGFSDEHRIQRNAIIQVAHTIMLNHRNDWLANLLNALSVPCPPP